MTFAPGLRRLSLTAHVCFSVGWLGAVLAYLALAITGVVSPDALTVRSAYIVLELIGWCVIVPSSLAALATGLVQSLGTEWGLIRHYWVLLKLVLTVIGVTILLVHMRTVSQLASLARQASPLGNLDEVSMKLIVHAGGGLLLLVTTTALSFFKPWGRTRYYARALAGVDGQLRQGNSKVVYVVLGAGLLLFLIFHLSQRAMHGH